MKKQIAVAEVGKLLADKRIAVAGLQVLPIGIGIVQLGVAVGLVTMPQGTFHAAFNGAAAGGAVLVVWLVAAYLTAGKAPGMPLSAKGSSENHRRLLASSEAVAKKMGVALPPIHIDQGEDAPNVRTVGLLPSQFAIVVTKGLLGILSDEKQFQAVIAHELVHIQSGDTFAQALLCPVLALSSLLLRLAAMLFYLLKRERVRLVAYGRYGMGMFLNQATAMMSPLLGPFAPLAKPFIFLTLMMIICMVPMSLLGALASSSETNDPAAALLQVPLLFVVLPLVSFAILRHREALVDRVAAQVIGDKATVAYALGNCIEHVPDEAGQLEKFIAANGVTNEKDLVEKLKTQPIRLRMDEKVMEFVRSHPYGLKRMASVVSSQH